MKEKPIQNICMFVHTVCTWIKSILIMYLFWNAFKTAATLLFYPQEGFFGNAYSCNAWLLQDCWRASAMAATILWLYIRQWIMRPQHGTPASHYSWHPAVLTGWCRIHLSFSLWGYVLPPTFSKITSYPYMWGVFCLRTRYSLLVKKNSCSWMQKRTSIFHTAISLKGSHSWFHTLTFWRYVT